MTPSKIHAENFQALDFEHELKPVNMFCGPNESGKTARMNAIIVALLGYHYAIGKQPKSTIGFAGENRAEMLVHLEFKEGSSITRTFKRKPDGDVARTTKGEDPKIPPVLFSASEYLNATSTEQIKTVFDRIDISKIVTSDSDLLELLGKIEAVPAAQSKIAVEAMLVMVKAAIKRRTDLKQTPQVFLEELAKNLADKAKGEKGLREGYAAQLQTIKPSGKAPISVAAELKTAKEELTKLQAKKAEIDAQQNNFLKTQARRNSLTETLAKPVVDIAPLEAKRNDLNRQISGYSSNTPIEQAAVTSMVSEIAEIRNDILDLKAAIVAHQNAIQDLEGKVKCPYCKSSRQGWKDEHATELQTQITAAEGEIKTKEERLALVVEKESKARADLAASIKADNRIKSLNTEVVEVNNQIAIAGKANATRAALEGELTGLQAITAPNEEEKLAAINAVTNQNATVLDLENKERDFQAYDRSKATFATIEKNLLTCQVSEEVFKQAAKVVVEEQKAIVAKAFESILDPARKFTDGIIGGRLDYQHDELGIQTDTGWVGHRFMSKSQQLLAYTGLQIALAQQSPVRLVFIDEAGQFDRSRKSVVISRMLDLTATGFIDLFIGTEPMQDDYSNISDERFQLVVLGK